ncbi:MAG: hypothetical protein PHQ23_09525 [Candidatus Wallbacteria bacterium]|nr:hypothetical protein [Candidatus Wallbacteria bacterium]
MNKKQVLIVMVVFIAISGVILFTERGKKRAPATPPNVTQAQAVKPKTPPVAPQPGATDEIAPAATNEVFSGTGETTVAGGTEEIDLEKIVWAREYLKKYKGRVPDELLKVLNDLMVAADSQNRDEFIKAWKVIEANFQDLLEPLGEIAQDSKADENVRRIIVEMIGSTKKNSAIAEKILIATTAKVFPERVRENAVKMLGLGDYRSEAVKKVLMQIASDPESGDSGLALTFMWKFKDKETEDFLHNVARDSNRSVDDKVAAVYSLGAFKNSRTSELLKEIIVDEGVTKELICMSMETLVKVDPDEALPYIKKAIASADQDIRSKAVMYLIYHHGDLGQELTDELVGILLNNHEDFFIRGSVAGILSKKEKLNDLTLEKIRNRFNELDEWGMAKSCLIFIAHKDVKAIPVIEERINTYIGQDWDMKDDLRNCIRSIKGEK